MRKLTFRERILLACLIVVALVSGYMVLFYGPTTERMEQLNEEIALTDEVITAQEVKLAQQKRMQQELEQLAGQPDAPPTMPEYDNTQAVLKQLNGILNVCQEFTVTFSTTETEEHVVCRQAVIPFRCSDYTQAKSILQQLHDSTLRSMLDHVELTQEDDGGIQGNISMVFFEYLEDAQAPQTQDGAAS